MAFSRQGSAVSNTVEDGHTEGSEVNNTVSRHATFIRHPSAHPVGISTSSAALSWVTTMIGAGIMALPQLPVKAGLYATVALALVSAAAISEASGAYFRTVAAWNSSHGQLEQLLTFEDFGRLAFGQAGRLLISGVQILWFLGVASAFVMLVSMQCQNLAANGWSNHVWALIVAPLLWFLCMLRDLSVLARLMPLGVATAIISCLAIVAQAMMDAAHWQDWSPAEKAMIHSYWPERGFMPMGSVLATLIGAFSIMGAIPPVMNVMENKAKAPKALNVALSLGLALYSLVILLGYWGYGNFIQGSIAVSMRYSPASYEEAFGLPVEQWTGPRSGLLSSLLSLCILVNLVISYPLVMMCIFESVGDFSCARMCLPRRSWGNYLMRTGLVITTLLIANSVPSFGVLFSLFASVCGPLQGIFIPILFSWNVVRQAAICPPMSWPRLLAQILVLLLGTFCLVVGLADSVSDLVSLRAHA